MYLLIQIIQIFKPEYELCYLNNIAITVYFPITNYSLISSSAVIPTFTSKNSSLRLDKGEKKLDIKKK